MWITNWDDSLFVRRESWPAYGEKRRFLEERSFETSAHVVWEAPQAAMPACLIL